MIIDVFPENREQEVDGKVGYVTNCYIWGDPSCHICFETSKRGPIAFLDNCAIIPFVEYLKLEIAAGKKKADWLSQTLRGGNVVVNELKNS